VVWNVANAYGWNVAMETGKHKGTLHWQDYYLGLAVLSKIKRER